MINLFKSAYIILNKEHKKKLNTLYIIFFLSMILEMLSIGLFIPLLSNLSGNEININKFLPGSFATNSQIENVIFFTLLLGLVFTIKTIFLTYGNYKIYKFFFELNNYFSRIIHSTYLNKTFSFHTQYDSSTLIRDINDIRFGVGFYKGLIIFFAEILVVFGVTFIITIYNPVISIATFFSVGLIGMIFYKIVQSKAKIWGKERQKHEEKRYFDLQLSFNEIKNIKLLNKENYFNKEFADSNYKNLKAQFNNEFVLSLPKNWLELITLVIIIFLIFFLITLGYNLSAILTQIGIYCVAAYRLVPSITRIMNSMQQIKFSSPVISKIKEVLKSKNEKEELKKDNNINFKKTLELKKINFSFNSGQKLIFEDLNLNVDACSFNGIIGKSGVGKSTLINILTGLLFPTNGQILVDGTDIQKNLKSWRNKIGYVPQNVNLSNLSIRENIAFGQEQGNIEIKNVLRAIKLAQLENFVEGLNNGIDTKIGEFGSKISGGQKQRIGIARALYNIPQVLILDESTNSLDENTENEILKDILKLKENKITLFLISHDRNTLSICDNIFEIKNKNIFKL